ncbi:hypothetical protein COV18_04320 [Candidatus Woesearchaeota archaeon CG10_big_fil_rev_8_21_14_0_10_37_12]|nr:MAG: hypothetical protein COV18_04320 [Candidatus Woesearchaeota archaeon CG10_big_fil_rev_8_21_14_0_10_37_12]
MTNLLENAKKFAGKFHKGQYRKDGVTPYITHPAAVAHILEQTGVTDQEILAAAWLHDVVEDTSATLEDILNSFTQRVAGIVEVLTRNCDRETYKTRILNAGYDAQLVKIADMVHNCSDIAKDYSQLPRTMVETKIKDCEAIYLILAERVSKHLYHQLRTSYERVKDRVMEE